MTTSLQIHQIPSSGLVREFILHGLAFLSIQTDRSFRIEDGTIYLNGEYAEELGIAIDRCLEHRFISTKLKQELKYQKLMKNDSGAFQKRVKQTLNVDLPENCTYLQLMKLVSETTAKQIRDKTLNPEAELTTFNIKQNVLGSKNKNHALIVPAIIKTVEYSDLSKFLHPGTASGSMSYLSPLWFTFMSLGFLLTYGGYNGSENATYFFMKPTIENYLIIEENNIYNIVEMIGYFASINAQYRIKYTKEEIYELRLAMHLAEFFPTEETALMVFPIRLMKQERMSYVFVATNVVDLDLTPLVNAINRYQSYARSFMDAFPKITQTIFIEGAKKTVEMTPLQAVLAIAEDELTGKISQQPIAYSFVRDFYKALSASNYRLLISATYAFLRTAHVLQSSQSVKTKGSWAQNKRYVFTRFASIENIEAILECIPH